MRMLRGMPSLNPTPSCQDLLPDPYGPFRMSSTIQLAVCCNLERQGSRGQARESCKNSFSNRLQRLASALLGTARRTSGNQRFRVDPVALARNPTILNRSA